MSALYFQKNSGSHTQTSDPLCCELCGTLPLLSLSFLKENEVSSLLEELKLGGPLHVICFQSLVHPQPGHHHLSYILPGSWSQPCIGTEANEKCCFYSGWKKKNHTSFIFPASQLSWMLQEFKVKKEKQTCKLFGFPVEYFAHSRENGWLSLVPAQGLVIRFTSANRHSTPVCRSQMTGNSNGSRGETS